MAGSSRAALLLLVLLLRLGGRAASHGRRPLGDGSAHWQPHVQHYQQPSCLAGSSSSSGQAEAEEPGTTPFPTSFWLVKTIKTGSTTLAGVLRHVCGHYGVVPVSKRRVGALEGLPDADAAAGLRAAVAAARNATDASEFAVITHLKFSEAKAAAFADALDGRRPLLLTSVRHPLARTYSHFIQAKCANAAAALRGKIIECDRNATFLARLLALDTVHNRWAFARQRQRQNLVYHYVRGAARSVEDALAHYDWVFVSERMDEALVGFMLQYGLQLQDIAHLPSKNRTGKYRPAAAMPAELNKFVLSVNALDLALWRHANALLDARIAALAERCGRGAFDAALAAHRALQAEVGARCADFGAWYARRGLPASQLTYVNDEGWGWRCVRHVARQWAERSARGDGGGAQLQLPLPSASAVT